MFYTQLFTSKRGPLAKIWLAAHWERKLTKTHIHECNLEKTIRDIISPKMKIGLRTSGHLLLGVVRIYSKKTKYLLADCSEALVKIKTAFRPDQTDLPQDGLEATAKAINLNEDFEAFEVQLPQESDMDVDDHFSLNQGRTEDITMKEVDFLSMGDMGTETMSRQNALLDLSFTQEGDTFGDEDKEDNFLEFLINTSDPVESEFFSEVPQINSQSSPLQTQQEVDIKRPEETANPAPENTILHVNGEEAFTLEPVSITPNEGRTKGKRKRQLLVDHNKQLSDKVIREQLSDYSDLVTPLDMAPPTFKLMKWKESGGVEQLFSQPCSTALAQQIKELFAKNIFHLKCFRVCGEVEEFRQTSQEDEGDVLSLSRENITLTDTVNNTHNDSTQLSLFDDTNNKFNNSGLRQNGSEVSGPELPSEDSMFVHLSTVHSSNISGLSG
uniref:RAD21 cohesin complex component like 1 n=1 Tax=Cynoglossus semilaevis TaxID=244447 RepID=A0A3P8WZ99_CYNSE